jgi:hypothetical protein
LFESRHHRRSPPPAGAAHGPGDARGIHIAPGDAGGAFVQQSLTSGGQGTRAGREIVRTRQAEGLGQTDRRRHAERRRPHEGEQLQHVEGGKGLATQPPGGGRRMTDDGCRGPRLGGGFQRLQMGLLPVAGKPDGVCMPGHQYGLAQAAVAGGGGIAVGGRILNRHGW